jgi:metacaspase-1
MAKRALVVGINDYPGTGSDLYGCLNDAYDWRDALAARGFDIASLFDFNATRDGILTELKYLLGSSESGDLIVFTYSGHGTWVPSKDADEPRDEAICPYDIRSAGPITDDELFAVFSRRPRGVRVVMVADSCFSGTLQRLAGPLSDTPRYVRFLPPEAWMDPQTASGDPQWTRAGERSSARSLTSGALVLAGCGDKQVCYDASFDGRPNGAFSYVALKALAELPNAEVNYRAWMRAIRTYLPSRDFDQKPQLDGLSYQKSWPILEDGDE